MNKLARLISEPLKLFTATPESHRFCWYVPALLVLLTLATTALAAETITPAAPTSAAQSVVPTAPAATHRFETDRFDTPEGPLEITFVGHGTLIFRFAGKIIHLDPWSALADYGKLAPADLVLLTHHHRDHLDRAALEPICHPGTQIVMTALCEASLTEAGWTPPGKIRITRNGETFRVLAGTREGSAGSPSPVKGMSQGVTIESVPAYNIIHKRDNGQPFHPRGEGNGYVMNFAGLRVYAAGDTEKIPEMAGLKDIAIAFLPMNLPFTMTPEMAADAARSFMPGILYPYHFGETDTSGLSELLVGTPKVEVRIRNMK